MRFIGTLAVTGSLLLSAAGMSGAVTKKVTKTAGSTMIECPFMHKKVEKSKAIKVSANGKTMYVCCKGCEPAAKKQLMAKK
jgi:hypothetical protein